MDYVQNSYNKPSFQANLKISVPVKDKIRAKEIAQAFEEKTQDFIGDVLHISEKADDIYGKYQIHHLGTAKAKAHEFPGHIMPDFNEMLEKLSNNQIVEKLVKLFKIMKLEKAYSYVDDGIVEAIEHTSHSMKQNILYRDMYARKGKPELAKTYETLIENNKQRIANLQLEQIEAETKVAKDIDKISSGDEDLQHIPSIYDMYRPE